MVGGYCIVISFILEDGVVGYRETNVSINFGSLPSTCSDLTEKIEKLRGIFGKVWKVEEIEGGDIRVGLWRKFISMVGRSSVGAVCRSPLQEVYINEEGRELFRQSYNEIYELALKKGIPVKKGITDKLFEILGKQAAQSQIPLTSSMQRDIVVSFSLLHSCFSEKLSAIYQKIERMEGPPSYLT